MNRVMNEVDTDQTKQCLADEQTIGHSDREHFLGHSKNFDNDNLLQ